MACDRLNSGMWRIAVVLVVLLSGQRDARAQGAGATSAQGAGATSAQGAGATSATVPEAASQCLSCHGPLGRPDNAEWPIIGGQNAAYLASALRAYRAGQRTGDLAEAMTGFVRELDDPTIDQLAAFFAALRSLR